MIDKEEFIVIHTLHKRGYSIRAISKIVGLDRRTISKRLQEKDLKPYKKIEYKSKLDLWRDEEINSIVTNMENEIKDHNEYLKESSKKSKENEEKKSKEYSKEISENSENSKNSNKN